MSVLVSTRTVIEGGALKLQSAWAPELFDIDGQQFLTLSRADSDLKAFIGFDDKSRTKSLASNSFFTALKDARNKAVDDALRAHFQDSDPMQSTLSTLPKRARANVEPALLPKTVAATMPALSCELSHDAGLLQVEDTPIVFKMELEKVRKVSVHLTSATMEYIRAAALAAAALDGMADRMRADKRTNVKGVNCDSRRKCVYMLVKTPAGTKWVSMKPAAWQQPFIDDAAMALKEKVDAGAEDSEYEVVVRADSPGEGGVCDQDAVADMHSADGDMGAGLAPEAYDPPDSMEHQSPARSAISSDVCSSASSPGCATAHVAGQELETPASPPKRVRTMGHYFKSSQ